MGKDSENVRLREAPEQNIPWKKWVPYLSERQWGTVREDSSKGGDETIPQGTTRRRFLLQFLTVAGAIAVPILGFCQTPGMERRQERRQDRREDGADRMEQRGDKMEERADDPIGVRGPERREDRRDLREDRHDDRRERIY
jgi:hypothetical protein